MKWFVVALVLVSMQGSVLSQGTATDNNETMTMEAMAAMFAICNKENVTDTELSDFMINMMNRPADQSAMFESMLDSMCESMSNMSTGGDIAFLECVLELHKCSQTFVSAITSQGYDGADNNAVAICAFAKGKDLKTVYAAEKTCVNEKMKAEACKPYEERFEVAWLVKETTLREDRCSDACKDWTQKFAKMQLCAPESSAMLENPNLDADKVCAEFDGNNATKKCLKEATCGCPHLAGLLEVMLKYRLINEVVIQKCPTITGFLDDICKDDSGDTAGSGDGTDTEGNGTGAVAGNKLMLIILAPILTALTANVL